MIKKTNYTDVASSLVNHLLLLMGRPQTKVRDKLHHNFYPFWLFSSTKGLLLSHLWRVPSPHMTGKIINYRLKWIMKI